MAQLQSTSITGSLIVTGGITGSFSGSIASPGSNTQVLYNNSGVISADSGFVYSSGNVGIGTTSPSQKLEVNGGDALIRTAYIGNISAYGTNYASFSHTSRSVAAKYSFLSGNAGDTYINAANSQAIYFRNENIDQMIITSAGNVGIGTASPGTKLDVSGNISGNGLYYNGTLGGELRIDNSYGGGVTYYADQNGHNFYTWSGSWVNRLAITDAGNVGIGTTSPSARLDIRSLASVGATNAPTFRAFGYDTDSYFEVNSNANNSADIKLTRSDAATMFKIDGHSGVTYFAGDVGIGTTTPNAKLHISANALGTSAGDFVLNSIHFNSNGNSEELEIKSVRETSGNDWTHGGKRIQLRIDATYMGYMQFNGSGNQAGISFGTGTTTSAPGNVTERMRITNGGNVGIGITNPSKRLVVAGNGTSTALVGDAGFTDYAGISLNGTLDGGNYNILSSPTDLSLFINRPSGNDIRFRENNVNQVTIATGGNVGIGTASPISKLHVYDGYLIGGLTSTTGAPNPVGVTTQLAFEARSTAAGNDPSIAFHKEAVYTMYLQGQNSPRGLSIYAPPSEAAAGLFVQGNVGIGTTNPSQKLEVSGRALVDQFQYTKAIDYSSGDLNSLVTAGFYDGNGMSNAPNTGWFYVTVETHSGGTNWVHQTATSFGSGNTPNEVYTRVRVGGTWGTWLQVVTANGGSWNINAATATNLSTNRTNWNTNGTISAVVGQLAWKNYGNNHTIFDASNSTSPDGGATSNTNPDVAWSSTYPTLMGWNGSSTYGVRVDSARTADSTSAVSGTTNYVAKFTSGTAIGNSQIFDNGTNVGIGTTSPGAKLEVNGSFRATTKSFIIDHPTKENKKLQYGVLEGPEHSVYVRGKLTNTNVIQLPDYWHALVHEDSITVNLTAIGKKQDLWVEEITDTYITIASETGDINCFYAVFAERKDVEKLVTEFDK
jgi:hypothetical protein